MNITTLVAAAGKKAAEKSPSQDPGLIDQAKNFLSENGSSALMAVGALFLLWLFYDMFIDGGSG